jgi:hypothetical protein
MADSVTNNFVFKRVPKAYHNFLLQLWPELSRLMLDFCKYLSGAQFSGFLLLIQRTGLNRPRCCKTISMISSIRHVFKGAPNFHQHADEVEKTVFFHTANLFNRDVDQIFYDTTSASFHIDYEV